MTNKINTTDEWITSATDAGKWAIIESVSSCLNENHPSLEQVVKPGWYEPVDFKAIEVYRLIESIITHKKSYRIKNQNYVKLPKRSEIWRSKLNGKLAYCYSDFEEDHGFVSLKCGQITFISYKDWDFTGETTDLFDKLDALDAGGCDE